MRTIYPGDPLESDMALATTQEPVVSPGPIAASSTKVFGVAAKHNIGGAAGGLLGGMGAGAAVGALGGPFAPITVPIAALLVALLVATAALKFKKPLILHLLLMLNSWLNSRRSILGQKPVVLWLLTLLRLGPVYLHLNRLLRFLLH